MLGEVLVHVALDQGGLPGAQLADDQHLDIAKNYLRSRVWFVIYTLIKITNFRDLLETHTLKSSSFLGAPSGGLIAATSVAASMMLQLSFVTPDCFVVYVHWSSII